MLLAIGLIEAAALLSGFSPSASLESALPDLPEFDGPEAGLELGPLSALLSWLSFGRVPVLILLVIFLASFALSGFAVQWLAAAAIGMPLAPLLAAVPATAGGLFSMRQLGRWLARIFPRDHSEAASQQDVVGSVATIIRGEARPGQPAEAKAQDMRGRSHYLLVEPKAADATYRAGDKVVIVSRHKNIYRAVTGLDEPQG
ncbi:MAG: hypothetical protein JWR75_378 [Devosia sp.]|nr:hypothetical protein [Devosia sp.]